jgi:hypothetical protein
MGVLRAVRVVVGLARATSIRRLPRAHLRDHNYTIYVSQPSLIIHRKQDTLEILHR